MADKGVVINEEERKSLNFIEQIIEQDLKSGATQDRVHTRFPPEPNGYLHIGHAKSICLNFGLAKKYGGKCNLRFDDTNPEKESDEYVNSIKQDVQWLGFQWDGEYYASDYFEQLYDWAVLLIKEGKAYVDNQSADEVSATRGTTTTPGVESPHRNRSVEENLDLFERMRSGEFPDRSMVLRAKIDMASPNMLMRDPAIYRIKHAHHHRTGDKWCIYPMYDFAHGQSDYLEKITHSICTLEFEVHRPLYDWLLDQIAKDDTIRPHQYEFARLNLTYTVMSKRRLLELVENKYVTGWDDPRMPTLSGMRRRGYTPTAIRNFSERVGVTKRDGMIDVALLEDSVREDLNKEATRRMAILDPVKVIITNLPEGYKEDLMAVNNPEMPETGRRPVPFEREIYIERDDFMEDPPKKFFRLGPDRMVRLKYGYILKCTDYLKNKETGVIEEIHCEYYPESKSGDDTSGLKVKGTIHWLGASNTMPIEVRMYDRLFTVEDPQGDKEKDYKEFLNPDSLMVVNSCLGEKIFADMKPGDRVQFERKGYFTVDPDSTSEKPVFNLTVGLKDSWAKIANKMN